MGWKACSAQFFSLIHIPVISNHIQDLQSNIWLASVLNILEGPDLTPIKPTPIKCNSYKLYRFHNFCLDFIGHRPFQCPIIIFACPITFEFKFVCPIIFLRMSYKFFCMSYEKNGFVQKIYDGPECGIIA